MNACKFLIAALSLGLQMATLAMPVVADAQPPAKVPRIGLLSPFMGSATPFHDAFRQGLRDLGYTEGQTIAIEHRSAEGRNDRLPDLAGELVRLQVDVIVTTSPQAVRAAKEATSTIPIVMAAVGDAVEYGFVGSLGRPGGNITGSSWLNTELSGKRLELLKQALPGVAHVAALWDPSTGVTYLRPTEVAARSLAMDLHLLEVRGPKDFERAFETAKKGRAGGLLILPSVFFTDHRMRLVGLAAKKRLPAMYFRPEFVGAGGLMSYGPDFADMYRRAAYFVDKILKGAKPADLPVEQPTRFELIVNLMTAKALGLTIPQSILIRADQVIQ